MRFLIIAAALLLLLLLLPLLPSTTPVKIFGTAYANEAAPKAKAEKKMARHHKQKKKEKVEYLRAAPM